MLQDNNLHNGEFKKYKNIVVSLKFHSGTTAISSTKILISKKIFFADNNISENIDEGTDSDSSESNKFLKSNGVYLQLRVHCK